MPKKWRLKFSAFCAKSEALPAAVTGEHGASVFAHQSDAAVMVQHTEGPSPTVTGGLAGSGCAEVPRPKPYCDTALVWAGV